MNKFLLGYFHIRLIVLLFTSLTTFCFAQEKKNNFVQTFSSSLKEDF